MEGERREKREGRGQEEMKIWKKRKVCVCGSARWGWGGGSSGVN